MLLAGLGGCRRVEGGDGAAAGTVLLTPGLNQFYSNSSNRLACPISLASFALILIQTVHKVVDVAPLL